MSPEEEERDNEINRLSSGGNRPLSRRNRINAFLSKKHKMSTISDKIDQRFGIENAWALIGSSLVTYGTQILRDPDFLTPEEMGMLVEICAPLRYIPDLSTFGVLVFAEDGTCLQSFPRRMFLRC